MHIESVMTSVIDCDSRLREADPDKVATLAKSIQSIGLLNPIHLHTPDDGQTVRLVAGLHRLEAVKSLGWESVDAILLDGDSVDCRLAEIAENLHRAELTKAERADQIAEWIRLVEEKQEQEREALIRSEARRIERESDYRIDADDAEKLLNESDGEVSSQLGTKSLGRPKSGVKAAARELGVSESQADRAVKIASMTPAAKKAAKAAGLDDNQKALERIARKPETEQVAEVTKIKKEREDRKKKKEAEREKDEEQRRKDKAENDLNDLIVAWKKASPWVRDRFRAHIKE